VGRRGVKSSFKLLLPVFATHSGGGEGIRGLWSLRQSLKKVATIRHFSENFGVSSPAVNELWITVADPAYLLD
jgi:hypothetical protein